MELNVTLFESEESARNYLVRLRWDGMAKCVYCSNNKAYFIEKGKRFKCANPECYRKFSVTSKTLMEASNVPLNKWVQAAWLYTDKGGDCKVWDLEKTIDIASLCAGNIKDKFDFCWKYIKSGSESLYTMEDLFKKVFQLYEAKNELRRTYVMDTFENISDIKDYKKVLKYTKYWLRFCHWIPETIFTPEDVIAETFLYIYDTHVKEYNAETISFFIRKVTCKMWMQWVYAHPNTHERYKQYSREWHRQARQDLRPTYVHARIKKSFPEMTSSEIRHNKELIKLRKDKIKMFREKFGMPNEWKYIHF